MKVSELIKQLTELDQSEEIVALVYHKGMFTDLDGSLPSDEAWGRVADQFYMNYDHTELYSALSEACIDESDMEEVA